MFCDTEEMVHPKTGKGSIGELLAAWDRMSEPYLAGPSALIDGVVGQLVEHFTGSAPTICEPGWSPGTPITHSL
jgi:hypothetical protein